MAPGRPIFSVGIQPQIALYSVILGSVCALSWYTEKYHRDESDLDERVQKLYLQTAQEAQSSMPQMAAAIRGQSRDLDGRMNKMVWGGKAQLKNGNSSNGSSSNNNGTEETLLAGVTDEEDDKILSASSEGEENWSRKRRKRKRKKDNTKLESSQNELWKKEEMEFKQQQQTLIVQSSIAGVAIGAISVAAVSVLLAGGRNK